MQRLLIAIGLVTAAILIAASAAMNYVFMSSMGRTSFEGYLLGCVSVAVDVMKALLAVFVAAAAREGKRTFVIIGSCAFLLFTAASMVSAAGFASLNRGAVVDQQDAQQKVLSEAERDLRVTERKLAAVPAHRPALILDEEMAALRIDIRWSASKRCQSPTSSQQREHCLLFARLRSEVAAASEAARLETLAAEQRERIDRLRSAGAATASDPQARLLAQALGLSENSARRLLMALLALVIEVSSGFGVYLATGHRSREHPERAQPVPAPPEPPLGQQKMAADPEPSEASSAQVEAAPDSILEPAAAPSRTCRGRAAVGVSVRRSNKYGREI